MAVHVTCYGPPGDRSLNDWDGTAISSGECVRLELASLCLEVADEGEPLVVDDWDILSEADRWLLAATAAQDFARLGVAADLSPETRLLDLVPDRMYRLKQPADGADVGQCDMILHSVWLEEVPIGHPFDGPGGRVWVFRSCAGGLDPSLEVGTAGVHRIDERVWLDFLTAEIAWALGAGEHR